MKNIYTLTELSKEEGISKCDFCPEIPNKPNSIWKLKTRNIQNNRLIDLNFLCLECKEKYDNDQFKKCSNCERLKTRSSEYRICSCFSEEYEQEQEEIEPERYSTQLERQIHSLSLEKSKVEEDLQTEQEAHLDGIDATARWYKRQHEEEMTPLQEKSRRLSDENKKLKSRIKELETQLLDVEEVNKKVHGLSNENRNLKSKVEGLEAEIEKYKGEVGDIQPTVSQLKFDILRLESRLEQMLLGTKLEARIEITPN